MRSLCLLVLAPSVALAGGPSPLWDDVVHPDRPRCDALTAELRTLSAREPKDRNEAIDRAVEVARRCPSHAGAQAFLGIARAELAHDYAAALGPLERARKLEDADLRASPDPLLAFHLGLARLVAGDVEGALEELRRAQAAGGPPSRQALVLYDLGDAYHALGRLTEAIDAYRRALRLAPGETMCRLALAVALDRDEQLAASRAELEAASTLDLGLLEQSSEDYVFVPAADQWYYLALAYRQRGRLEQAREAVARFLHELPDGPFAARARELQASLQR